MNRRGGLGRGLASLIPPGDAAGGRGVRLAEIELAAISANPQQPREVFDDDELDGLATSIADMGVLQPVVVRPLPTATDAENRYELVAGERRVRAARRAGLTTIPAVIRETEDSDLLKEALVENIHRVQLNPLEEAAAYRQLLEDFDFTQEELATRLGKSRPAISNAIRLLSLTGSIQRKVAAGVLSAGHAKALLAIDDTARQERMAERIIAEGMSVRATEELVRLRLMDDEATASPGPSELPDRRPTPTRQRRQLTAPALVDLQDNLSDALMARVKITMGARRGRMAVEFASVDDLERIVGVIARGLQTDIDLSHATTDGDPAP